MLFDSKLFVHSLNGYVCVKLAIQYARANARAPWEVMSRSGPHPCRQSTNHPKSCKRPCRPCRWEDNGATRGEWQTSGGGWQQFALCSCALEVSERHRTWFASHLPRRFATLVASASQMLARSHPSQPGRMHSIHSASQHLILTEKENFQHNSQ